MSIPVKSTGEGLTADEANQLSRPGISIAQAVSGIPSQAMTTSYAQLRLTNTVVFESPSGIIETTYPSSMDSVEFLVDGIFKFGAIFYIEGPANKELFVKAYKNGVAISAGDPVGVNLLGTGKPVALPFTGHIPLVATDVITYYAKLETAGNITINGGNAVWEKTNY